MHTYHEYYLDAEGSLIKVATGTPSQMMRECGYQRSRVGKKVVIWVLTFQYDNWQDHKLRTACGRTITDVFKYLEGKHS